jgi:hypothetical protein
VRADTVPDQSGDATARPRVSLALSLVVLSWFAWMAAQTVQLARDRVSLNQARANQEIPLQESTKVRTQFTAIAAETARLAAQGNSGAQAIVVELQRRGIRIDPNAKSQAPPDK